MKFVPSPSVRKWVVCLTTFLIASLIDAVDPLHAQPPSAATVADGPKPVIAEPAKPEAAKPIGAPSVVLEFNDAGTTFKQALEDAHKNLRQVIVPDEKLRKLQTTEKNFRDHPNDSQAAADYAEAFADSLTTYELGLRKFLESRDLLEKAHRRFVDSSKSAIDAIKKERDHHTEQETRYLRQAQEMESELDRLSEEFEKEIEDGEPLPPEIDRQVVRLSGLIEQRRNGQQLHADRMKRAARNQKKLELSLSNGQLRFEQMELRFEKADGDVALIGEIAQAKAEELAPDPVSFEDISDEAFVVVDLKPFLSPRDDKDEADPTDTTAATKVQSLGGTDVLKARRKNRTSTSAKPDEPSSNMATTPNKSN